MYPAHFSSYNSSLTQPYQTELLAKQVESLLLNLGQPFFLYMAKEPLPWLQFACEIESKPLWREAVTHAVGQFNHESVQEELRFGNLNPKIVEIVKEKAHQLKEMAKAVETALLSHYPDHLQRTATTGLASRDGTGRGSYQNDIMTWIALNAWRHWMTQMIIADRNHNASDMGYEFFSTIYASGEAYLDHSQMNQFHHYFPMSDKAQHTLKNNLDFKHNIFIDMMYISSSPVLHYT